MYYSVIKPNDIADGNGVRVSLFVSGCKNHCEGCFNKDTWDFKYGKQFTDDTIAEIINLMEKPYIKGLSILGGEPLEIENQYPVMKLILEVRNRFGLSKDIWLYTGYVFDIDKSEYGKPIPHTQHFKSIIDNIDYVVDGPFVLHLKNLSLNFRGSSNQKIYHFYKQGLFTDITDKIDKGEEL